MALRLSGWDAIAFAERNGCTLSLHAGDGEEARSGVDVTEARRVAATRPGRVYVDFDEERGDGSAIG